MTERPSRRSLYRGCLKPFQGDSTRKTDGGTGLGLAIAHKIIEKHKGTLNYVRAEEKKYLHYPNLVVSSLYIIKDEVDINGIIKDNFIL